MSVTHLMAKAACRVALSFGLVQPKNDLEFWDPSIIKCMTKRRGSYQAIGADMLQLRQYPRRFRDCSGPEPLFPVLRSALYPRFAEVCRSCSAVRASAGEWVNSSHAGPTGLKPRARVATYFRGCMALGASPESRPFPPVEIFILLLRRSFFHCTSVVVE